MAFIILAPDATPKEISECYRTVARVCNNVWVEYVTYCLDGVITRGLAITFDGGYLGYTENAPVKIEGLITRHEDSLEIHLSMFSAEDEFFPAFLDN